MRALSLLLCSCLSLTACAPARAPQAASGKEADLNQPGLNQPGLSQAALRAALMPPAELPRLFWRQRLQISYAEAEHSLDVVLQNDGESFQVLALGPANTRLFLVSQRGKEVELKRFVDREIPLDPALLLLDIQRALFWFPAGESPLSGQARPVRGFCTEDQFDAAGIKERRIADLPAACSEAPPLNLLIRYTPPFKPGGAPQQVVLSHQSRDYAITVTHIETGSLAE